MDPEGRRPRLDEFEDAIIKINKALHEVEASAWNVCKFLLGTIRETPTPELDSSEEPGWFERNTVELERIALRLERLRGEFSQLQLEGCTLECRKKKGVLLACGNGLRGNYQSS